MNKRFFALAIAASTLVLAGCPATVPKHGQFDETEFFPDGSVKKKTVASSDYALYIAANKASAPVAKVKLPAPGGGEYSVEIPMVAGQTQTIAAPQIETSGFDRWADRGIRVAELFLRGYGIARNADVQLAQSHDQRDVALGNTAGFVSMGNAIRDTSASGNLALGQVPRVNQINVSGNALLGDGNFNLNSNNVSRICNGGPGADGGNGGATTNQPAPGAPGGPGGAANC